MEETYQWYQLRDLFEPLHDHAKNVVDKIDDSIDLIA